MNTTADLIRGLRAPDQRGAGRAETAETGASNIDRLADLDRSARMIQTWDSTVIPGNLQIPAYSRAVLRAAHPRLPEDEVARRVALKDRRAKSFLRHVLQPGGLEVASFAIGERAIVQCLNLEDSGDMHAEQLHHLVELSRHPRIRVRIMPDSVPVPGLADRYSLYTLDDQHRVGYVETIMGAWYSTRLEDVVRLQAVHADIGAVALTPTASRTFTREVLMSWRTASQESPDSTEGSRSSSPPTP